MVNVKIFVFKLVEKYTVLIQCVKVKLEEFTSTVL
jgi:hypothetical protein